MNDPLFSRTMAAFDLNETSTYYLDEMLNGTYRITKDEVMQMSNNTWDLAHEAFVRMAIQNKCKITYFHYPARQSIERKPIYFIKMTGLNGYTFFVEYVDSTHVVLWDNIEVLADRDKTGFPWHIAQLKDVFSRDDYSALEQWLQDTLLVLNKR